MAATLFGIAVLSSKGEIIAPVAEVAALLPVSDAAQAALDDKANRGHTPIADTDYQALATDVQIGLISLTASRTVRLPDVDTYPMGQVLFVADESGNCSEGIPIIIAIKPGSNDTIAGQISHTMSFPYQGQGFRRGAANLWIFA